jgi:hypothetical protein
MALGKGWEAQIGLGNESTWGTPVARTRFIDMVRVSGGLLYPLIERETFRGRSPLVPVRGAKLVDGEIESELLYEGWEDFFYHLFGKVTTTTINVTAKQHVFAFDDTLAMPVGLTVEVKYGAAATELWEGCKVESMRLVAEIDKILKATFKLFGEDISSVSPTSPTYPTADPIRWNQITIEKDDVATPCVSADITIANGYSTDRRKLGSASVLEHVSGKRAVSGTLVADYEDLTAWKNSFTGDTVHKLELIGTGGNIAGSSPTDQYDFILTVPFIKVEAHGTPISEPGIIRQEMGFVAHKAASELATLLVTNLRATVP